MSKKLRLSAKSFFAAALFAFCILFLSACSDRDAFNNPSRASILVTHPIQARALGPEIKRVTYYCYNEQGFRTFGPANLVKAQQILLQAVPVESVSISMTYYNNDGDLVGYYSQPVALKIGEVYSIDNPEWEDLGAVSNIKGLTIKQQNARIHTEDKASFSVMAEFEDKASETKYQQVVTDICFWDSANKDVLTNVEDDRESSDKRGECEFTSIQPGKATVSAVFEGIEAKADAEVTDSVIEKIAFDENKVVIPLSLSYYENHVTAYWSDGKTSDVSVSTAWTVSDIDTVQAYYGYIVPKKTTYSSSESGSVDSPVTVNATALCAGEAIADTCTVSVTPSASPVPAPEEDADEDDSSEVSD